MNILSACERKTNIKRGTPANERPPREDFHPEAICGKFKTIRLRLGRDIDAIVGRKSNRDYDIGGLLLRNDFRTAPNELRLTEGETALSVPIDIRATNTSQITPGETRISFYIPRNGMQSSRERSENQQWIGPFDVLAVGNRMGSTNVIDGQTSRRSGENMVTLKATDDEGKDIKGMPLLMDYLIANNFKPLRLKIHAAASRDR